MKLLKEIKYEEFPEDESTLTIREASRAILFDENNLIPVLFDSKYNYYKIPGGGIEEGEDKLKALVRECLEEIGCEIEIEGEIGKIVECRSEQNFKQISYCYYGKIISKGEPNFTKEDLEQGHEVLWLSLEEAISKIESNKIETYGCSFIQERELSFLREAKRIKTFA